MAMKWEINVKIEIKLESNCTLNNLSEPSNQKWTLATKAFQCIIVTPIQHNYWLPSLLWPEFDPVTIEHYMIRGVDNSTPIQVTWSGQVRSWKVVKKERESGLG